MKTLLTALLLAYLQTQSGGKRLARFNALLATGIFTKILLSLKPKLFPAPPASPGVEVVEPEPPGAEVLAILDADVRGRRGTYHVERWLGARGAGYLFQGVDTSSQQPVVVKEFLLPARLFNEEEAAQRQQAFTNLADITLADGRIQDSRVMVPIEAIADTNSFERCYLITDDRDASPTLRQRLSLTGPWSPAQVRDLLDQVLQTLIFLHQQRFMLPTGHVQTGIIHGNLGLDSLLWVEQPDKGFIYLCDLALWERVFDPPAETPQIKTVAQDLIAVGQVALALWRGAPLPPGDLPPIATWPEGDLDLRLLIQRLLAISPPFTTAQAAREALRALPPLVVVSDQGAMVTTAPKRRWAWLPWVLLLGLLAGVGILGWWLWQRSRLGPAIAQPRLCCLAEVAAVPEGQFLYTAVDGGAWSQVARQQPSSLGVPSLGEQLEQNQPTFQPVFQPADSFEAAVVAVASQQAAFAVIPLVGDLPYTLAAQVIAYDALVMVVPYSYAQRQRGLPRTLGGQLRLEQVRRLYGNEFFSWREVGGADIPVRLYGPNSPETLSLFEALVYGQGETLSQPQPQAEAITLLPPFEMLRAVIRDFETEGVGSLGFAPLSQVSGQCSIYPLALGTEGRAPVQPLVLTTGEPITPQIDLCNRKGQYFPDAAALRHNRYPLAYPIAVIYPLDNRLPPVGQKFAELMLTDEGQQFLWQQGFVPVHQEAVRVTPRRISEQNVAN